MSTPPTSDVQYEVAVIQGEGGGDAAETLTERRTTRTASARGPARPESWDYRHPISPKVRCSAAGNMRRALSRILFLLLLFGKPRPVSIEPNAPCFSHDMNLCWRLLGSSFGGEGVETSADARTHSRVLVARCAHRRVSTTRPLRAPNTWRRWAFGMFNLFPPPPFSITGASLQLLGALVWLSSGHHGDGVHVFGLHPQLSPEEKHVDSCAGWNSFGHRLTLTGCEEIPKSSFQRGSEARMIGIVMVMFE